MTACLWCERAFTPRASGGKPQHFCRSACRRALDAAGRRWIAMALGDGQLTIDTLRNGAAATRALAEEGKPPPAVSEAADALLELVAALPERVLCTLSNELF